MNINNIPMPIPSNSPEYFANPQQQQQPLQDYNRIMTINNAIYHYSTVMYEYQQNMRNNLRNNFMVTEYTKRMRDYQNDMNTFISYMNNASQPAAAVSAPQMTYTNNPIGPSPETHTTNPPASRSRFNQSYVLYTLYQNGGLNSHTRTPSTLENIMTFPMENVIVAPSREQIENATERVYFHEIGTNTSCPISLEDFNQSDRITRIRHCGHVFKSFSLETWFHCNVRCPVCRYDIRDYVRPENQVDVSNSIISGGTGDYREDWIAHGRPREQVFVEPHTETAVLESPSTQSAIDNLLSELFTGLYETTEDI
jgi:hypothetical protein